MIPWCKILFIRLSMHRFLDRLYEDVLPVFTLTRLTSVSSMYIILRASLALNICSSVAWCRPYPQGYFTIFYFQCFPLAGLRLRFFWSVFPQDRRLWRDTGTACTTASLMGPFGYRKLGNLTTTDCWKCFLYICLLKHEIALYTESTEAVCGRVPPRTPGTRSPGPGRR